MSNPPLPTNSPRTRVLVAGVHISGPSIRFDPGSYQAPLAIARKKFGSAICLCQNEPLQLVIRERNNKLFLACWPDQAHKHSLDCPFYAAEHESASSEYSRGAITEDGQTTTLQLHHPIVQTKIDKHKSSTQPKVPGHAKCHIWGLLHHLWESAALNRWHPGWHRDWGMVRAVVRRVAQSTLVDTTPLLQSLYIPPVWTERRKDEISTNWDAFTRPLQRQHRGMSQVASGFVIGTVRKLETSQYGFVIRLQHHSTAFYIDWATSERLASYSRRGWAAIRMMEGDKERGDKTTVIVAMRVQAAHNQTMVVVEGALMRVSKRYIPVASSYEERMANQLVQTNRRFVKPLHYDLHSLDLAHFILADCVSSEEDQTIASKVAVFVYGATIASTHQFRLEKQDRELAKKMGYGYWKWNAAECAEIPPLPSAFVPHSS